MNIKTYYRSLIVISSFVIGVIVKLALLPC